MKKEIYKIEGMHCASCAANIEHRLAKKSGIHKANVNFAVEKLYLDYDENIISFDQIEKIINSLGYKLFPEKADDETGKMDHQNHEQDQSHADHKHTEPTKEKEIQKLRQRFLISLIFGLPIIYMVMGKMLQAPIPMFLEKNTILLEFILATIIIGASITIWLSGIKELLRFRPGMDSLIFIGTVAAYIYSIIISISIMMGKQIGTMDNLYYESAAFILIFINLGRYLEAATKGRTSLAIKRLMGLAPKYALVIKNGQEIKIPISEVVPGNIVLVKPGAKIPVDGVVIDGYSAVDEKAITGESIPAEKNKGDKVIGATINKTGVLKIKAQHVGKDTVLAQIIKIVEEAMGSKAPIQLLADKVSFYFVPAVIVIALISALIWLLLGFSFSFSLTIFVAVLIIACPCALGLATPTAIMMGSGLAAQRGILIKNGEALEKAQKINFVVFDKTGTLTKGEPKVVDIIEIGGDKSTILKLAASIEKNSEHPLAQAIINKAKLEKIELYNPTDFQAVPGQGVKAKIDNKEILLGTRKLLQENKININEFEKNISNLENLGKTVIILAFGEKVQGLLALADTLKENSQKAIKLLHENGIKTAILTGDNARVGKAIAKEVGIDKVLAEVLPHEKAANIKKLQKQGWKVAMVGDGINDAPALAQADLGVALGSGTDVAMETGELILIKNNLLDVVTAIDLSKYTLRKIKQNLFWAFFYNIISIPVAAGLLYPFFGWILNPSIAAAAMAFSSVSVVTNALLMKGYKK